MDKKEMIEGLEAIRDSFDINTAYHKIVVQEAINTLKEKTEPVAEVPCSDGLDGQQLKAKQFIDANVWDGEDRSGATNDRATFNPDELQELINDLIEYMAD
jgi:hypothetical protein